MTALSSSNKAIITVINVIIRIQRINKPSSIESVTSSLLVSHDFCDVMFM